MGEALAWAEEIVETVAANKEIEEIL